MPAVRKPLDPDILYSTWASNGFVNLPTAIMLGCSEGHVRTELIRNGFTKPKSLVDNTEIIIDGTSRGLVLHDVHIPLTNWQHIDFLCEEAKRIKATDWLALPGDFLNQDATSRHQDRQEDAGLEEERAQARRGMNKLRKVFERIVYSLGNHDLRLVYQLEGKLSFSESIKMFLGDDDIEVTGRDYVLVESPEGLWRACHTKSYSRNPVAIPAKLADRHRCHIISGHTHHHAIAKSPSGYWAISNGTAQDYNRTEYLHRWTTDFPVWGLGGTFLINGEPYCPMLSKTPSLPKRSK